MPDNEELKTFLKDLYISMETNEFTDEQIKEIGEFYMRFKFNKYKSTNDISDDKLQKYLSIGWYIYNIILNHN